MNHREYVRLMNVIATLHNDSDYEILERIMNELMGLD